MTRLSGFVAGKTAYFVTTFEGIGSLILARLSYQKTGLLFIVVSFVFFELVFSPSSLGNISNDLNLFSLSSPLSNKTQSIFEETESVKTTQLTFSTKTIVDPSLTPGETRLISSGKSGRKTFVTKVVFHNGTEYSRETKLTEHITPTDKVIAVGISAGDLTLETPYGLLKYNRKLSVWATSYDPSCQGCSGITAIGLKAGFGVIAVDPTVIPLRSKVYIPGYGVAIAGDTGGSIKGNKVDLGFDSVKNGWWSAKTTDIYILTN